MHCKENLTHDISVEILYMVASLLRMAFCTGSVLEWQLTLIPSIEKITLAEDFLTYSYPRLHLSVRTPPTSGATAATTPAYM
jgi:hypothetical protein